MSTNQQDPTFAQCASWWLVGQALADPADLLRGLLQEHESALATLREIANLEDVDCDIAPTIARRALGD